VRSSASVCTATPTLATVLVPNVVTARDNGQESLRRRLLRRLRATAAASSVDERGTHMAAMKPRTGDGDLEVTKEGRGIVMRVPLEGGGRLVVELSADEARALGDALKNVVA
jgi:hypothetical protein